MKKGVSKTVVFLIIVVVGAIVLFTGTKLWAEQAEGAFDKETCRASVVMVALSKTTTGSPWLKLKCSTEKKEINNENFKEKLVKSIKDCSYQYGSAKIDFISNWDFGLGDTNCFVCSILTPKGKIILSGNEMRSYLLEQTGIDFGFKKDIIITSNDPLYVIYGITKKLDFLSWKILFGASYKPSARYTLILYPASKVDQICDGGPEIW